MPRRNHKSGIRSRPQPAYEWKSMQWKAAAEEKRIVFTIHHPIFGNLRVSRHAWERFKQRYEKATGNEVVILSRRLKALLEDCLARVQILEIIHYRGRKICDDPKSGLRFIIAPEESTLVTVFAIEDEIV